MSKCETCKYSVMAYEAYYGGGRQYFVDDCKKGNTPDGGCEDYEAREAEGDVSEFDEQRCHGKERTLL